MESYHTLIIYQINKDLSYSGLEFALFTTKIILWCEDNIGPERKTGWWYQVIPDSNNSKMYLYFRDYDDYIWCRLTWSPQ